MSLRMLPLLCGIILSSSAFGQHITVKGHIMDTTGEDIIGATIKVNGGGSTVTDQDGTFTLHAHEGDTLRVSHMGFKDTTVPAAPSVMIRMEDHAAMLGEVVVAGTWNHTKLEGGALVTRIEGSALQEVGSLETMLARVPGMQRNGETLEVIGRGEPEYYINGRKVQELVELKRLNSRQIERVEVLVNPGAEYGGEVMAVVRIFTRSNFRQGLGVEITGRSEQSIDYSHKDPSITSNLRYHIKNVDLKLGLNYWHTTVKDIYSYDQQTFMPIENNYRTYGLNGDKDFWYKGYNLNYLFGADWRINDRHTVTIEGMIEQQLQDTTIVLVDNTLSMNGRPLETLHTETHTRAFAPDNGLIGGWTNTRYVGHIGKTEIGAQLDTYNYRYTERNRIDESNQAMFSITHSGSQLYVVKAYGAFPIWRGDLRIGTELSFFHRLYTNENNLDGIVGKNEDIYQHIYAGYAEYHLNLEKRGTLVAGLRYEHDALRIKDHLDNSTFHRPENYIFPSLSYSVRINDTQLSLTYTIKTHRPGFAECNDAIVYDNRYSLSQGNSRLKNEIRHELSLQMRNQQLTCGLSYEHRRRAIVQGVSMYNDEGTILYRLVNQKQPIQKIIAFINYKPVWGIYQPNWTVSVMEQIYRVMLDDPQEESGKRIFRSYLPIADISLTNAFVLKKAWQLELNYNLLTPGHKEGNMHVTTYSHDLTAAIQKSFLKNNALTLRIEARDMLGLTQQKMTTDYGYSLYHQCISHDNRRLCLSLRYSL